MCGIAGFFQPFYNLNLQPDTVSKLNAMKDSLYHRGPDDGNIYCGTHGALAHRRLPIIDIQGGAQPMQQSCSGSHNKCTIVYNGELYNTADLKLDLHCHWQTTSDTEVILNGYIEEGPAFFEKLNGIFAFAIYDERNETMILCRDRLGVKPLFYTVTDNHTLVFGSEIKALFAWGIHPVLDRQSFCEIFALGPARTPGCGVFKNIREVLPGHWISFHADGQNDHTYWSLKGMPHTDSYAQTTEKVSWLVYDSIKRQMVSDIPICTFLSGGLDSSLVSAVCARELKKQGLTLDTFSFDFEGNAKNFKANAFQSSQDRPFVDIMVSHIHSNHHYLECSSEAQAKCLYNAVDAADLPCMADVESSMLYFCSQVSKTNKVTLTGECADEIFGGYPWFHQPESLHMNCFPWSKDMTARTMLLREDFYEDLALNDYAQNAYAMSIKETPALMGEDAQEARRREIAWLNIRWFMATLLNRMDRTSMYSGLEARVPFADHRILEYVYNIPWAYKCYQGQTKSLLIEAGRQLLPEAIRFRKKSPYPKTYDPGYEKMLGKQLLDTLSNTNTPIKNIVDIQKLKAFLQAPSDYGKPWYGQLMAGPQMLAYLLQVNYWLEKYNPEIRI